MASYYKRRSKKPNTGYKARRTVTTTSTQRTTTSNSHKVGGTRITYSTSTGGNKRSTEKVIYTTYVPGLGYKRETRTLNKVGKSPKRKGVRRTKKYKPLTPGEIKIWLGIFAFLIFLGIIL